MLLNDFCGMTEDFGIKLTWHYC